MVIQSFWFQVRWWDFSKEKDHKNDVFMCCYVHTTKEHSAVCVQLNRALNHDLDKQIWSLYCHACYEHCPVGLHWVWAAHVQWPCSRQASSEAGTRAFVSWLVPSGLYQHLCKVLDQIFQISQQLSLCPLALHKITHLKHMLQLLVIWFSYTYIVLCSSINSAVRKMHIAQYVISFHLSAHWYSATSFSNTQFFPPFF